MQNPQRVIEYLPACNATTPDSPVRGEPGRVRVRNLAYLFAPHSEYPLAPAARGPIDGIAAFAVDMDGTSTTTEPLALHALEYMVRRFTGRLTPRDWSGLDPVADYPNVIGHSNQHHTAFLLERYRAEYQPAALREAFLEALAWTLTHMGGTARVSQVIETARMCGLQSVVTGDEFRGIARGAAGDAADGLESRLLAFLAANSSALRLDLHAARVRVALDVYYMRYHSILLRVQRGDAAALSRELLGDSGRRLIEPMPGYAVFVALVKGWLGADASMLTNQHMGASTTAETRPVADARSLTAYAKLYERTPAKLALVTASIGIEANIVMDEVRRRMADEVHTWPIASKRKDLILANLADRERVFDAFVTADDACEHRLKPHPDLYSLALHRMGIDPADFHRCVGVEDTEAGIVSLRAAGVGCAVALPNHDTRRQDFRAAAHVFEAGLPELLGKHHLLVNADRS